MLSDQVLLGRNNHGSGVRGMAFKVCSSCGKQVREIDSHCWNCKSMEFQTARTVGTPAAIPEMNDPAPAQPKAESMGFWAKAAANAKAAGETKKWGNANQAIICPQCQTKGHVRTLPTKRKAGISGAKATGAVLTLGWSLLATGLSRKQQVTHAHCDNCGSTWDF
jgi:hypothetical protein